MPPPGSRTIWPSVVTPSRASESRSFGSMSSRASGTALAAVRSSASLRSTVTPRARRARDRVRREPREPDDDRARKAERARSRAGSPCPTLGRAAATSSRKIRSSPSPSSQNVPGSARLDARRQRVQRRAQLGDRRFDLLRRRRRARAARDAGPARARSAGPASTPAARARSHAHSTVPCGRSSSITTTACARSSGSLAPHQLERQRREIEAGERSPVQVFS